MYTVDAERFWKYVASPNEDGCRNWKAGLFTGGYGQFRAKDKKVGAHRVAYFLTFGDIPEGKVICHTCSNKLCCEPTHLVCATQSYNIKQAVREGTHRCGSRKLTAAKVRVLRMVADLGKVTQSEIANIFEISEAYVSRVVNGKAWAEAK